METRIKQRQLMFLNHVLNKPKDSITYNAWKENESGDWESPYRKLWTNLKFRLDAWGCTTKNAVKECVSRAENSYILKELPKHESLLYLPANSLCRTKYRPLRTVEQSILSTCRIGDWRIGVKELVTTEDKRPPCPMCNSINFTFPHFLLWCTALDKIRRECGLYSYIIKNSFLSDQSERETIQMFLDAEGNEPKIVKRHGGALIKMRNAWYKLAKQKNYNLNVRTKEIFIDTD